MTTRLGDAASDYMAGECSVCGHVRSECRAWFGALNASDDEPTKPDNEVTR